MDNNILNNLTKTFSNDYYFDLHLPKFTIPNGTKSNSFYIENTKDVYLNNHPTFNKDILNEIDNPLQIIAKNDSLICLDNTIILKELYKIISHIDLTNELLDFIETKSYPKKYFASFQGDTREVQREMHKHKNIIVNARTHISTKGEARLNWWFYNMFSRNKKLAKFYLNILSVMDISKCAFLYTEKEETIEKVFTFLSQKAIQQTTRKDILKSLSIMLYHECKSFLNISPTEAKELTAETIQYLYPDYSPNDEEFDKTIYIRSNISFIPIFGATRKKYFQKEEKDFIKKSIIKESRSSSKNKDIDYSSIDTLIDTFLNNPHNQFLLKYPVEFFRTNPKYSTLK